VASEVDSDEIAREREVTLTQTEMKDAEPAPAAQERSAMGEEVVQVNGKLSSGESESPKAVNAKAEDAPAEEATRDEVNADTREDEASDPAEIDDDPEEETTKFVEWDPTGRFGRTTELLGRGTYKNVYKAFDEEEGMDVAWNQVKVHGLPAAEKARLLSEVEILKRLDHKNVLKFYHSWNTINEKSGEVSVNFITEACAGTLNKYAARFKNNLDMRAVKSWCRQILRGLAYLHAHEPPIVHRDLKCDNIFVNGNAGEIKIGDLGLAAMLDHQRTHSVIGTPEFMAPELYEEDYDERVDIYSFGMCLIELVTFECPYCECKNPAQIYKRVSSGVPPASLEKIKETTTDSKTGVTTTTVLQGKGSAQHHATVVGDTVGDPMKDTSGPSLNILIKLSAITSLVFGPAMAAPTKNFAGQIQSGVFKAIA